MRILLLPLTLKQFKSMQSMARHQPELKKLQAKYKDDKDRLNQELMKFYRENKINPLASCLPLLAQIPVFISLFYMLREDLRAATSARTSTAVGDRTTRRPCPTAATRAVPLHPEPDRRRRRAPCWSR